MEPPEFPAEFLFPATRSGFDRWEAVATGVTGTVHRLSAETVVKFPRLDLTDSERDIAWEHHVYVSLGAHPRLLPLKGTLGSGLLLEYQPGGTIRDVLHATKAGLKKMDLFKFSTHITEGLAFIHSLNVIHADVSLSNVLITKDQQAVLCDFAGACLEDRKISDTVYGIRYQRPSTEGSFVFADDLFALGSAIYEMEKGRSPYSHKSDDQVNKLYAKGSFPSTRGLTLRNVIEKCWHCDYFEASEVLEDIRMCFSFIYMLLNASIVCGFVLTMISFFQFF